MKRSLDKEMMDCPGQPHELLVDDLRNLRRLNRYLGNRRNILSALSRLQARERRAGFTLLDIGTGSGDIPVAAAQWAQARNLPAKITALEYDAVTIDQAAIQIRQRDNIVLVRADAMHPPFRRASFDYVLASQLLHHFSEEAIVALLKNWSQLARRAIIVSDLVRHPLAYCGIRLLTVAGTNNQMTRVDAPLSVRRAFTLAEWRVIFQRANLGPFEVRRAVPFRMQAILTPGR